MQQLHLVGLTTDHTGLILSARRGAKTGKFSVPADDKLLAALQEAQRRLNGDEPDGDAEPGEEAPTPQPALALAPAPPPKPVSSLSPREIQARLRAGGTVSEIALAAGVDQEWILRFADPIRAEQARVVDGAQSLTFNKSRLGLSAEPLETSVLVNLAERGVRLPADVFATAWQAYNLHGTSWAVVFSYTSRQRRQSAQWEVDLRSGELVARNRLASDLGYVEPGRRRRRLEPLEPVAAEGESAGARPAAPTRRAATRKTSPSAGSSAAKKRAAKQVAPAKKALVAKKRVAGKKAAAANKGGGRQNSPRGRRPGKKAAAKKPAAKKPAPTAVAATSPKVPVPAVPALPERPTHLARPPSPMNRTNRAVTLSGRLVGAPSLRPPPPPTRTRPPAIRKPERQDPPAAAESSPQFVPTEPAPREEALEESPSVVNEQAPPQGRRRRAERRITPNLGDKPAVVILSTPAVRRLESDDKGESKTPAPPS